ncbi:MAG: FKBP-type peptidyl-prolyl cis-trans isomerase [Treponema sp.]|jgi:FKBP-type peptidyl-prolyl cis-trans isomerase|nr:FKBP-type peptidyl-prolyl cis-trans isomerase [Treponema sp.]
MKYQIRHFVLVVFLCALTLWGCNRGNSGSNSSAPADDVFDKDTSYAIGMNLALNMKDSGFIPEAKSFFEGFKDGQGGGKTRFSAEEAEEKIEQALTARTEKENEGRIQAEKDFLTENGAKPNVITTGSGLQYEVISEGSGAKPSAADIVRVDYEGTFTDGSPFDSSYAQGQPAEFPLNMVISGWTEGLQLMSVGSKYKFYIPSNLAYGPQGGGRIPPYSVLIFEVELLDILAPPVEN